ncbi:MULTISPECIES: ATP-grasp domain-containing protein [unclassified Coleofasciculus]|uniref:ATP-grasp domain-containing protein n=1 Tax=unclassified Coleofasciculus TaxID=2692782 RepID=UPI00188070CC|nr:MULTISPECIES: ATP-grasp domain-containing protein [unclassified Coleofasciculus]MBE9127604.1 acetate--CoA ligase family protein [Coleofasciculus sp. LEGE 07081]MBE9150925.1 acetate--CoA ligase family protein [Coleofasciculus sp. LEGE 07092]
MDLLEYQAKELFREIGIPVLSAQRIDHPRDLKRLEIPYPVVLKSQVPKGGRGKAGGIRLVENTIDAIAAARAIFNLPILGQYPKVLLAESHYDAQKEFYLAVILDYALGRPVLLGSSQGGIHVEGVMAHMQRIVVEREFSPFYARRLAFQMGLQGEIIESVSEIVQKMYQLFVQKDLDLVEINPLAVSSTGEVMALDGKIAVNDNALGRHLELLNRVSSLTDRLQLTSQPTELKWTDCEGNIGILCNSTCLAAATLDLVYQAKGKPASCLVADGYASWDLQLQSSPVQQLQRALQQFIETRGIQVVLVNILSSAAASEAVAEVIANYLLSTVGQRPELKADNRLPRPTGVLLDSRRGRSNPSRSVRGQSTPATAFPHFVIRVGGGKIDSVKERLTEFSVDWTDSLEQAVAKAVSLAKSALSPSDRL